MPYTVTVVIPPHGFTVIYYEEFDERLPRNYGMHERRMIFFGYC